MKITGGGVERFLRQPDPAVVCTLVYGPNQGLVRERAEALVRRVAGDLDDPFRVVELTGVAVANDPARLADEAAALSFSGGLRVVRVRAVNDGLAKVFEDFLAGARGDAQVVVEAGHLASRSSLRRVFERAGNAAALACYQDDERGLQKIIAESLAGHGLTASPDALAYLTENLGADRQVTRNELEKLALYKGGPGTVSLEDAAASVGDSAATSYDAVAYAAAGGDQAGLDRALNRAFTEGLHAVGLLRAVARHLRRLHLAIAQVAQGRSPKQAMKALRPPVIFLFEDRFRAQMGAWPDDRLAAAMEILTGAEVECKTTGLPARAVCGRALMRIAQAARQTGARP
ncbi:MAG: DNA polymerase III subunit delta [Rhodospirillales bacterium]